MDKPKRYERFIQSSNLCGTTNFSEVRRRWWVGSDCKSDALGLRGFESLHFHEKIGGVAKLVTALVLHTRFLLRVRVSSPPQI